MQPGGFARRILLAVILPVVLTTACSPKASSPFGNRGPFDPPTPSAVEGLPLPRQVTTGSQAPTASPVIADIRYLAKGVELDQLQQWYEQQLPTGSAWRSWKACAGDGVLGKVNLFQGFQRTWSQADGRELSLNASQSGADVLILIAELSPPDGTTAVC